MYPSFLSWCGHLHILKFHICIVNDFKLESHIAFLMFVMCVTRHNNEVVII